MDKVEVPLCTAAVLAGLQLVHIPSLYNVLRVLVITVDKVSQDFQSRKSN